jgi:hypothetical protein
LLEADGKPTGTGKQIDAGTPLAQSGGAPKNLQLIRVTGH